MIAFYFFRSKFSQCKIALTVSSRGFADYKKLNKSAEKNGSADLGKCLVFVLYYPKDLRLAKAFEPVLDIQKKIALIIRERFLKRERP
jgi:hypothetical protein